MEARTPVFVEPSVGYHSFCAEILTRALGSGFRTLSGGRFDWGGRLPKSNGGAQRFPQRGWKSREECKGIRELNRETHKSTWYESRA